LLPRRFCQAGPAPAVHNAAAAASTGTHGPSDVPPSQPALNRWLRARTFPDFVALARAQMTAMDQANLVVCLGRVIRELNRGEHACDGAEELAWELLQRCRQALESISSAHTLTNLAWSLARLDGLLGPTRCGSDGGAACDIREMMRLVIQRALDLDLESFGGRDVAILLWAAATLHRKDPQLLGPSERSSIFRALASGVGLALPEVAPQSLAMLIWALAVLDNLGTATSGSGVVSTPVPRTLFKVFAEAAGQSVDSLSSREVANVVWSFATVQVQMPRWLVAEVPGRAGKLRPQECANVLWAFASASESMEGVVSSLPCTDPRFLESWKPQEMANAAWALAHGCGLPQRGPAPSRSRTRSEALVSMHRAIDDRVGELNGLELAMVARTLGRNATASGDFLAKVSARALALLDDGSLAPDALIQVANGLTANGLEMPEPLKEAWVCLCRQAHGVLQRVADDPSPEVLQEIQRMGLTTIGAKSTEQLLQSMGLGARGGDDARAARLAWPDGLEVSTQVLCVSEYRLLFSGVRPGQEEREHRTLTDSARTFASGSEPEMTGLGLLAPVVLRFSRDRDAEFLALTAVVAEARAAAAETGAETWDLRGSLRLHVSHTPCLSCIGAMLQFRRAFPAVKLEVSFDSHDVIGD